MFFVYASEVNLVIVVRIFSEILWFSIMDDQSWVIDDLGLPMIIEGC